MIKENFVQVPRGSFLMGSEYKSNEMPVHEVSIDYDILISKYQVSVEDYMLYAQATSIEIPNDKYTDLGVNVPVRRVTWLDAVAYCKWLSQREAKTIRLPSEAEWEYACRASSHQNYCFGNDESLLDQSAWYKNNAQGTTHDIGSKKPNAWGIYDMHGNIWEWTLDRYADNYSHTPTNGKAHKVQSDQGMTLRGGAWSGEAQNCRSSRRINLGANSRNYFVGFRIVVELD